MEELIREIKKGVWSWYEFKPKAEIYIADGKNIDEKKKYDYVISIAAIEKEIKPAEELKKYKKILKEDGCLLLGMNNRLGIKYFCGDRDPYTKRNFDGIENYYRAYANKNDKFMGRMYSRVEIEKILKEAGFEKYKFYSVLSDLENAVMIYAENYLPEEDLSNRIFPTYNSPETIFMEEEGIYQTLIENNLFHVMANAYLIECREDGKFADVLQVTNTIERGKRDAFFTIIHTDETVEKRAVYPEGRRRLFELEKNLADLKNHGLKVIEGRIEDDKYIMPYVKEPIGQVYLKNLLKRDKEKFLLETDRFIENIRKSSEIIIENGEEILVKGYIDMMPLNSFYIDGEFVYFDQEFYIERCPLKMIISRVITTIYFGNAELEKYLAMDELYKRYEMFAEKSKWQKLGRNFLKELRKEKELALYHAQTRRNILTVSANRQRINYTEEEYKKKFADIFEDIGQKKIIIFGSGRRAERFMEMYGTDYEISLIVDNNDERIGGEISGIKIKSPEELREMKDFKVIICVKSYLSIIRQLEEMGISDYGIYEPNNKYQRRKKEREKEIKGEKKYRVGYIAGVFDLYHIGHLNMFRRAKEQCEYLIVGVVSDEGVRINKGVEPFVPYEERAEMVRSCRYVDEVVKIPQRYATTQEAWKKYQFDVQFSGSDYEKDGEWLAGKEFLKKHGSDLIFFPYTQSTSSTKLKKLIEKKLI